jgi:hypothetical protein
MKRFVILLFVTFLSSVALYASGDPIAYGEIEGSSNRQSLGFFTLWIGQHNGVPFLTRCYYEDANLGGAGMEFEGTVLRSFAAHMEPYLGKVGDVWVDGLTDFTPGRSSIPTVMHLTFTDSSSGQDPSFPLTYSKVDIYRPNNLKNPIFSRFYVTLNGTYRIFCSINTPAAVLTANDGVAFVNSPIGAVGMNDEGGKTVTSFWVSRKNDALTLKNFVYSSNTPGAVVSFAATRLTSFTCTSSGFLGHQAEFWLEGYEGINASPSTPRVARVIVTESEHLGGFDFMYIEIYNLHDLSKPIYRQVTYFTALPWIEILCGE